MNKFTLFPLAFLIFLAGCASTSKTDETSASAEKSSAPQSVQTAQVAPVEPAATVAPVTPSAQATPVAPVAAEQLQKPQQDVQSQPPVQQAAAESAKADLAKIEVPQGPVIVPDMVRIPGKNLEMGKYEVTQAEWMSVMGSNPSKFQNCGDTCPVEKVSWDDAQIYIQKLNAKTGKKFRLPTEEEWEYACLGGVKSEYCGGDDADAVAWTESRGNETTHPVGKKQANGYGLFDMSGNVMEWTDGCWEGNCVYRMARGGGWINNARNVRVSYRIRYATMVRNSSGGFRLALTIP